MQTLRLRRSLHLLALNILLLLFSPFFIETAIGAQTQDFGSFAYSPSTGVAASNIGYTKAEAQAAAELACRSQGGDWDCQAVAWFRNSLGALARASNGSWGWGWGSQGPDADDRAMKSCQEGGRDCQIIRRERTASIAITSLAGGETIAPMRWNWLAMGFTRTMDGLVGPQGQGDHVGRDYWAADFVSDDTGIYPVKPGRVVFAGWDCRTLSGAPPCYGNVVVIDHGNNISSLYAHLAAGSLPDVGRDVAVDDRIGIMSDSGCGDACGIAHLHFSLRRGPLTPDPLYTPQTPVRTPWYYGIAHSDPLMGPVVRSSDTFREGELVFFRLLFTDPSNDAVGFGFRGANGSGWAEENHTFSSPSYGRVSPGVIEYPFNLLCDTPSAYQGDVEAWVYNGSGLRSRSVIIHLACSAPQ
jgi:murein DD-endopeptidase MepM/ murein hydrolase activator NlpD